MIGAKNDLHPVPRRGAWLEMKEQAKSALPDWQLQRSLTTD
jgi:hypothetical protein